MVYIDKRYVENLLGAKRSASPAPALSCPPSSLDPFSWTTEDLSQGSPLADEGKTSHDAFKKIERLVKVRDRSIREVRDRLLKDGFSGSIADQSIERALRCNYLNDQRFADILVRSRLNAGKGLAGIIRELKSHDIDPEAQLPGFPDAYLSTRVSQRDAALGLLCRKPPRAKNKLQAAYGKLIRAGYTSQLASEVAREWYQINCSGSMR